MHSCPLKSAALFLLMVWVMVVFTGTAGAVEPESGIDEQTSFQIRALLEQRNDDEGEVSGVLPLLTHKALGGFYAEREHRPAWQQKGTLLPAAKHMVEYLRGAAEHGLCSDVYLLDRLEGLVYMHDDFARYGVTLGPSDLALLDLILTQAFLTYATHLVEGQVDPALTHVDWKARRRKANLTRLLSYALTNDRLEQVIAGLLPPHDGYRALVRVLAEYRTIAALGGWPQLPPGPALRPGDADKRVLTLQRRLRITGDLQDTIAAEESIPVADDLALSVDKAEIVVVYGEAEQAAVRRFQARHGLIVDGVVGAQTRQALNVTVEQRIRQLELNLERWRWLPKQLGERSVQVNIADFSLKVVDKGETVLDMPVIVGTAYRRTPVFSAQMTYLEMAPTWTVPPTILREDKLPAIKADPSYLQAKHFRILRRDDNDWIEVDPGEIAWDTVRVRNFPGLLRQDPGPWNPLGRVKFMFPNSFNVYLHDTNEPHLFASARRTFSSGCIRVEQPVALARYLLKGLDDWNDERLQMSLQSETPIRVDIPAIPVHILYWTAWVDEEGDVQFRPDIYYRDHDLDVALTEPDYQTEVHLEIAHAL